MKKTYTVHWEIEIDAESTLEAAQEALKIMRDEDSLAISFKVSEGVSQEIDLLDCKQ